MAKASWPILRVATGPCRLSSRTKTNGHTQSATASGVSAAPICCGCLLRDVGTCRGRTRGRAAQSSCCGCIRSPVGAEAKSGKSSAMPVHGRTSGEAPFTLTSEGAELRVPMTVKWLIAISAMQSRTCLRRKLPSAATLSEQPRRTRRVRCPRAPRRLAQRKAGEAVAAAAPLLLGRGDHEGPRPRAVRGVARAAVPVLEERVARSRLSDRADRARRRVSVPVGGGARRRRSTRTGSFPW